MSEKYIKRIICKMIEDGDIKLNVSYDKYERILDFDIAVSYPDVSEENTMNEVVVKQEVVGL